MAEQEEDEVGESDARLLFMFQYLSKSMRFKVDKWHKMMATEENKITVMEFLARAETKKLIFVLAYSGYLSPSDQFPTGSKNKACYFLKKEPMPVTVDNMKSMFIFGDISPKPLDQLAVLVEDVILPMLTTGNNKIGWPKSVAEDVKKRVLDMKDVVFRVKGEVYGRTLLPLPQGIERVHDEYMQLNEGDSRSCDMELRCTIESAVLRWSNQLNEVLKQSSASVFESEVNPVPEAEINFWSQRSKNLCGIYEQLRDHRVKKMATILEKTESAYFPCFQKMFKSVVSAMNEAEEIDRYLQVIVPYITEIQSVPFIETESEFIPLVHNIALIWVHCLYFQTSTKLVILLKEICNLLMQEANKLLDSSSLFDCEIEETLPKIRKVLQNLYLFRKIVLVYTDKIVTMFKPGTTPVLWTFDECLVFERYDKYIHRLKLIKELFVTTMEYMKLEKVEVGGNKAHALSLRLNELFENFNHLTASFSSLPYDPTNIDDDNFMGDYQRFQRTIMDCDRRLAAVACMAFDDCTNFEQIFKMMNVFGGLLVRPVIKNEIEPKYENIINLFEKEVDTVQNLYDIQMKNYKQRRPMDVPPNWPPVAGAVLWTDSLKKRLLFPLDNINTFGHDITRTERADIVKERAEKLIGALDVFREVVFTKWKKEVPSDIEHYLKESLLIVFHNKLIELNFHRQLVTALKEVRYLKLMDVEDLPQEALALFERNEEFHIWNVTLKKVTEWYNKMRLRAKPQEFELVADEITLIDNQINRINKEYRWESQNNWNQIKELHDIVWHLTDRMNKAQDNLQTIHQLANQWNYFPLYNRSKGKKGELLVYLDHQEVRQRFLDIIEAGQTQYNLIEMNYNLLHNIPLKNADSSSAEVFDENKKDTAEGSEKAENEDSDQSDAQESDGGFNDDEDSDMREDDESSRDNEEAPVIELHEPEPPPELDDKQNDPNDPLSTDPSFKRPKRKTRSTEEPKRRKNPARKCKSCQLNKNDSSSDEEARVSALYGTPILLNQEDGEGWFCFAPNVSEPESDDEVNFEKILSDQPRDIAFKIHEQWTSERNKFQGQQKEDPLVPVHPIKLRNERKATKSEQDRAKSKIFANRKTLVKSMEAVKGVIADKDQMDKGINQNLSEQPFIEKEGQKSISPSCAEENKNINRLKIENWEKYVNMIDDAVFDGLLHATGAAFSFLIDQMEPQSKNGPLFEVKMLLLEPDIMFEPAMTIDSDTFPSIMSIMTNIMGDIDVMPLLIPRISYQRQSRSYMDDVINHEDIKAMHLELVDKTKTAVQETENFVKPFYKYSYLWMENQSEHLSQFVRYARLLTPEDLELEDRNDEDGNPLLPTRLPTIDDFRKMIDSYDDLFKEISDMENDTMITAWIRIDLRVFKSELLNICSHWGMLYKQHLIDDIVAKLKELDQFIEDAMVELNKSLIKGDYDGLVNIMGYLLQIKQRQDETDNLFDPIREVITLLKSYGLDLSDQVYSLLGEMPDRWLNLKRLATQVRIMAQPLMQEESNTIRRRLSFFDVRQTLFKTRFKQKDFFNWDCDNPYWSIDEAHEEVIDLEEMCEKLAEQACLFEVLVPEFKVLKQTRKDTKLIKVLWDYILVVQSWIYEWECTEWKKIDSESMDMELKKFAKEMRTMDKDMRNWELYLKLESIIKNMITALRAITELQNPAIRDRHWKQLMQATKVTLYKYYEVTDANQVCSMEDRYFACPSDCMLRITFEYCSYNL